MKTKPKDKLYCGVREDVIKNAHPVIDWLSIYHFRTFVIDRYLIHVKKDVQKLPAPWTDNPILQEYKFTNVRREHDRQTRYLIKNIVRNPNLTVEDKTVNAFLFRSWNNWSTLKDFGFPYYAEELYDPGLKEQVRPIYRKLNAKQPNRLWFNNAYNQGGTKHAWKFPAGDGYQRAYKESVAKLFPDWEKDIALRPFHVGVWLGKQHIVLQLFEAEDQQEAFDIIKSVRGFADFLAYQVFVDLTYIKEFPFSENEFVISGPGCKRGLDYIFVDRDGMTYDECIFWLRDHINNDSEEGNLFDNRCLDAIEDTEGLPHKEYDPYSLFSDLNENNRCMNVMSLENCMCELSKYMRAVRGEGRPRNKYHGGGNK